MQEATYSYLVQYELTLHSPSISARHGVRSRHTTAEFELVKKKFKTEKYQPE
jgi:hypothetical protein